MFEASLLVLHNDHALGRVLSDHRELSLLEKAFDQLELCHTGPPLHLLYASLLTLVASRNLVVYQSLPTRIPHRQAKLRRRKDDTGVGAALGRTAM